MFDTTQLVSFVAVAAVLVMTPGPNTVLILTTGLAGGRSAGLAAVLGIETGTFVHSLAAGIGISALLAASPAAFAAVKYVGAAYLVVLGVFALMGQHHSSQTSQTRRLERRRTFQRALFASVLNPKTAVFFLAFLPQFVDRDRGHLLLQFLALGGIVALIGFGVGVTLTWAVTETPVRRWLAGDLAARWQDRVTGTVLLLLGARLVW